jgi:hypothetical protein
VRGMEHCVDGIEHPVRGMEHPVDGIEHLTHRMEYSMHRGRRIRTLDLRPSPARPAGPRGSPVHSSAWLSCTLDRRNPRSPHFWRVQVG